MSDHIYNQKFAKIVSEYIFSDENFDSEKYSVYSQVPVSCINIIKDGMEVPAVTESVNGKPSRLKIDMVLCVGNEIAMCVLLRPNSRITRIFNGPLRGIPIVEPSAAYRTDDFAEYAKDVLKRYAAANENKSVKYVISVCSVKSLFSASDLSDKGREDINNSLMAARAVDEELYITNYGIACGIMSCYSLSSCGQHKMKQSFKASKYSSELFSIKEYFGLETAADSSKQQSLKSRLKCLNLTIPSEDRYAKLLARKLKAFLNTPLSEVMCNELKIYHQLYSDINEAEKVLNKAAENYRKSGRITTYGDLMNFLYRMKKLISPENARYEKLETCFSNILTDLGNFIYNCSIPKDSKYNGDSTVNSQINKISLKDKLASLNGEETLIDFIFSMPLGYYYYAASINMNSNYPNWLCREKLLRDERLGFEYQNKEALKKSLSYTVSDERIDIFRENYDNYAIADQYVSFLYNLLVLPTVDIIKIKNLK